jgi:hypothetical protein
MIKCAPRINAGGRIIAVLRHYRSHYYMARGGTGKVAAARPDPPRPSPFSREQARFFL